MTVALLNLGFVLLTADTISFYGADNANRKHTTSHDCPSIGNKISLMSQTLRGPVITARGSDQNLSMQWHADNDKYKDASMPLDER
jgi:hypothetical protein